MVGPEDHERSSLVRLDNVVGLELEWSTVEQLTLEPVDHGRSSVIGLDTVDRLGVAMLNVRLLVICETKTSYLRD